MLNFGAFIYKLKLPFMNRKERKQRKQQNIKLETQRIRRAALKMKSAQIDS